MAVQLKNGNGTPRGAIGDDPGPLADQVRDLVEALGLTAADLAELCGVTHETGRRVLGNGPRPSRTTLLRLCDGLGLTVRVAGPDVETWENMADWVTARRKLDARLRALRRGK